MHKNTNSPHVAENRMGTDFFLVIQEGFEPPTHGLEGRCSIQLGYWTISGCRDYYITFFVKCKAAREFVVKSFAGCMPDSFYSLLHVL